MQEDTYRGDGLNLYAYCANNPVVYYDPSGHKPKYANKDEQIQGNNKSNIGSNGVYEKADYHGEKSNSVKSKAPNEGQKALDNSIPISPNTTRRIGISDGEIVVFDETINGVFHGHVRSWDELSEAMKAALRKAGLVNKKGKIIQ